ncbi:MAG TPA: Lrp/AsnC family transcriptional regulator [Chitinophagaceae bacterium]|jgi:Lrp/AsnC family leucine-responsive transcriptional regulator|nr:Lrp/AsnC family transcriptional regulator [Chitinophagaceae bacterium]
MAYSPDATDLRILSLLQGDACLTNAELAKKLGMAPSAVLERVKKLEQRGIIEAYVTRINPESLELKLLAFIFIRTSEGPGTINTSKKLAKIPEVLEVHHVAGEDCYLVKMRARDSQSLVKLMREKISKLPGIISTKTTVVLETIKETNYLTIPKEL